MFLRLPLPLDKTDHFVVRPFHCPTASLTDLFTIWKYISLSARSAVVQRQRSVSAKRSLSVVRRSDSDSGRSADRRSFILIGVNFNKAEVISMHLCFHSKTAAKVPLFSETAKQNLHFANSHLAKCRNVLSIRNSVREGYYLTISFICHFWQSPINLPIYELLFLR